MAFLSIGSANAMTLDEIKAKGEIRFAIDGETPPFNYFKGKKPAGFEVELATLLAKNMKLNPVFIAQAFNTLLVGIQSNRFDVIVTSHAMTEGRKKAAQFLNPLYCTNAVLLVLPGGPKTKTEAVGKVLGTPTGTVYYDAAKKIPGIKDVMTYPAETDGIQALLMKKIDAYVTDQFVAKEALRVHADKKLEAGEAILKQINAWVVAQGNLSLEKTVNDELEKLVKDGTFRKLSQRYFSEDIRCK